MSAGLAKSHICRNFPFSLIHAGAEALGTGLPHLFTVQGIARLSTLVSHSHGSPSQVCYFGRQRKHRFWRLDEILVHGTQSSREFLKLSPNTWTSAVMSFMAENSIYLHHNIRMDGYSQQDSFIMANYITQGSSASISSGCLNV
jgi:hypothetical protein